MTIITSDSPVLDSAGQPANGLVVWQQSEEYISAEGRVTTARGELRMKNGRLVTARGAQVEIPETPDGQFVTITENYGGSPIYWTTNIPAGPQAEYNELERIVPPTSGPGVPSWVSPVLAVPAYVDAKVALVDAAADAAATSRDEAAAFGGTNNSQVAGFVTATGPTKSAIEGVMGEAVGPLVAGAIADDATLVEAAILAVDGAVEGLDLAETTSDPEDEWRQAILFEDREVWIGQRTDGTWYPEQLNPGSGSGGGGDDELPVGGVEGQFLAKASNADGDVEWVNPPTSGGASTPTRNLLDHHLGQSNERGHTEFFNSFIDPVVPCIYQFGVKSQTITPASEPLDGIGTDQFFGPALQFARQIVANGLNTGNNVLILQAALGSTPLVVPPATGEPATNTWSPTVAGGLLDQWIAQRAAAIAAIEARGETWEDLAVHYTQGEQDSSVTAGGAPARALQYQIGQAALISKIRTVVGPNVPIILGGMVPEGYSTANARADIDIEKALAAIYTPKVAFVPSVVGYASADNLHGSRKYYEKNALARVEPFKKLRAGLRIDPLDYMPSRVVIDEFERASSTSSVGPSYTAVDGVFGLLGVPDAAYITSSTGNAALVRNDLGVSDGEMEFELPAAGTGSGQSFRMIYRMKDALNYWFFSANFAAGAWTSFQLFKRSAGDNGSPIGTFAGVPAAGDRVRVVMAGDNVKFYRNGVQLGAGAGITDSFQSTEVLHGWGGRASSNVAILKRFVFIKPQV